MRRWLWGGGYGEVSSGVVAMGWWLWGGRYGEVAVGSDAFGAPLELPPPPQFLHAGSPLREEIAAEVYEDEVDARRSGLSSSIASAWSERSFDPDDIRVGDTLGTFF